MLMPPPPASSSSSESYSMLISKHLGERQLARPDSGTRPRGHLREGAGRPLPPASGPPLVPSPTAGPPLSRAGPGRPEAWSPLLRSRLQCSRGSGDRLRFGGFSGDTLPLLRLLPPTSPGVSSRRSPALQGSGDKGGGPGPRGHLLLQPSPSNAGSGRPGSREGQPAPGCSSPSSSSSCLSSSSSSSLSSSSSSSGMLKSFLLQNCWRGSSRICSKTSSSLSVSQKGSGWGWGAGEEGSREERSTGNGGGCDLCPQVRTGAAGNPVPPRSFLQEEGPERGAGPKSHSMSRAQAEEELGNTPKEQAAWVLGPPRARSIKEQAGPGTAERLPNPSPEAPNPRVSGGWGAASGGLKQEKVQKRAHPPLPGRAILSHVLSAPRDRTQATALERCWHSAVGGVAADTGGRGPWNPRARARQPLLTPLPWPHSP